MEGTVTVISPSLGAVVSVRGSVVDVRFDEHLPPIYSVLRAGTKGRSSSKCWRSWMPVMCAGSHLTPTQGLARGMAVEDTGGPLKAPVGKGILSRMFDVFGNAIDRQPAPADVEWRRFIATRRPWRSAPPSPKYSKRASRRSTCWCRWSAAARRGCSAARASARRCCSPR